MIDLIELIKIWKKIKYVCVRVHVLNELFAQLIYLQVHLNLV